MCYAENIAVIGAYIVQDIVIYTNYQGKYTFDNLTNAINNVYECFNSCYRTNKKYSRLYCIYFVWKWHPTRDGLRIGRVLQDPVTVLVKAYSSLTQLEHVCIEPK